jgi:CHAT domain-containing protein
VVVLILAPGGSSAQQPAYSPQAAAMQYLQALQSGPPADLSRAIASEQAAIARAAALPLQSADSEKAVKVICERVAAKTGHRADDAAVYMSVVQAIQAIRVQAAYAPGGAVFNALPPQMQAALDGSFTRTFTDMSTFGPLIDAGKVDEVVATLHKNLEVTEGLMAPVFAVGGVPQSQDILKQLDFQVDLALSVAQRAPNNVGAVRLAFAAASVRKAKKLEVERRTSAGLRASEPRNAASLRSTWLALRSTIAAVEFQRALGVTPSEPELAKLREATAAEAQLEQQLVGIAKASRVADAGTDLDRFSEQLQARLVAGESLISYVRYQAGLPGATTSAARNVPRYAAFVLGAQGLSFVDLGDAATIDGNVDAYLAELDTLDTCPDALATKQAMATTLYNAVFAPTVGKLTRNSGVRLVTDGQLELLPFAALHDGSDWLLSRFEFSYANSERELLGEYVPPQAPRPPLVISWTPPSSNPPPRVAGRPISPNDLPALAGVMQEAEAVSQILPNGHILSGAAASENALFSAGSPSILHIAAHGVFVEAGGATNGGGRGLVLEVNAAPAACEKKARPHASAGATATPNAPDPLTRSALVLAPNSPAGDGFLTAYEVSTLDLWSTELAVLSACETGRGGLGRTEGVRGMRTAFSAAGARSLVASLWHVPDIPTKNLMTEFYAGLVRHKGRRDALQAAMLKAKQLDPDPSSWAAFVLLGDTGPLVALGGPPELATGLQGLSHESDAERQARAVGFANMEQGRPANPAGGQWGYRGAVDRQLAGFFQTGLGPARNNARLSLLGPHTAISFFVIGYHGTGTYSLGSRGTTAGFRLVSNAATENVSSLDPSSMDPVSGGTLTVTNDNGYSRQGVFSLDLRGSKLEGTFNVAGP